MEWKTRPLIAVIVAIICARGGAFQFSVHNIRIRTDQRSQFPTNSQHTCLSNRNIFAKARRAPEIRTFGKIPRNVEDFPDPATISSEAKTIFEVFAANRARFFSCWEEIVDAKFTFRKLD